MSTPVWLESRDAAKHVGARSLKAFDHWVTRRGVPVEGKRGRLRLFRRDTLDRVLVNDHLTTQKPRFRYVAPFAIQGGRR